MTKSDQKELIETAEPECHIRWMIRKDMPDVLAIEDESFERPWNEREFSKRLQARQVIGMVAEVEEEVVGYTVYEHSTGRIDILNIAVDWPWRGMGIGTAILDKLKRKLGPVSVTPAGRLQRRSIYVEVCETNVGTQKFLANNGFQALEVIHSPYIHCEDDSYVMAFSLDPLPTFSYYYRE